LFGDGGTLVRFAFPRSVGVRGEQPREEGKVPSANAARKIAR
jgi:hypothetical protein